MLPCNARGKNKKREEAKRRLIAGTQDLRKKSYPYILLQCCLKNPGLNDNLVGLGIQKA